MRRLVSLMAAVVVAVSLAASTLASAPPQPGTGFTGSFDTLVDGVVVGHVDAQIWPSTPDKAVSGWYSSRTADRSLGSSAQVGASSFYRGDGYTEVWFNALELFTGAGYAVFTGHFRDNLDPAIPDEVDFFGRPLNGMDHGAVNASLGDPYEFHLKVGKGAFVLNVR